MVWQLRTLQFGESEEFRAPEHLSFVTRQLVKGLENEGMLY
jgi:hypothetical protein